VSGDAVFTAARLAASALGGVLQVLGVCLPTPRLAAETEVVPALSELDAAHCNAMQQDIQRALSISPAGDPSWPVTVRVGSPPRVMAAEAVRRQAVVIVMGIGRHHPLDRAFGAETTIATLRESRVPVLAVASHVLSDSLHAVVGLDFSSASVQAARLAARLVAPNGRLTLLHVQPRFEQATANWQAWDAEYTRTLPPLFDAVQDRYFQILDGVVAHVKKIARAAGRIADSVLHQRLAQSFQFSDAAGLGDSLLPGLHNRGPDDLQHVHFAGEVLAVGVAGGVIAAGLEDIAEDAGPHLLPVLFGGGAEQIQLL
jgi:nucleotide-binding universal stress UspA family protein